MSGMVEKSEGTALAMRLLMPTANHQDIREKNSSPTPVVISFADLERVCGGARNGDIRVVGHVDGPGGRTDLFEGGG